MEPPRTLPKIRSGDLIFWRYEYDSIQEQVKRASFQLKTDTKPKECICKKKLISSPPTIEQMSQPVYWNGVGMLFNIEDTPYIYCMGLLPKKPILVSLDDFMSRCNGSKGKATQKKVTGPIDSYHICPMTNGLLPDLEDRIKGRVAHQINIHKFEHPEIVDDIYPVVDIIMLAYLMEKEPNSMDQLWNYIKTSRWKYSY